MEHNDLAATSFSAANRPDNAEALSGASSSCARQRSFAGRTAPANRDTGKWAVPPRSVGRGVRTRFDGRLAADVSIVMRVYGSSIDGAAFGSSRMSERDDRPPERCGTLVVALTGSHAAVVHGTSDPREASRLQ